MARPVGRFADELAARTRQKTGQDSVSANADSSRWQRRAEISKPLIKIMQTSQALASKFYGSYHRQWIMQAFNALATNSHIIILIQSNTQAIG